MGFKCCFPEVVSLKRCPENGLFFFATFLDEGDPLAMVVVYNCYKIC